MSKLILAKVVFNCSKMDSCPFRDFRCLECYLSEMKEDWNDLEAEVDTEKIKGIPDDVDIVAESIVSDKDIIFVTELESEEYK